MFLPPPQAPQDLFVRVQCFGQLPEYDAYLKGFASLPAPPESGWDLSWPFPSPPLLDFDQALPGYVGPYLQSLTPLGVGGARRSAPWPPPRRERGQGVAAQSEVRPPDSEPACQRYEEIPEPQSNAETATRILAARLVGDPERISALCSARPSLPENPDILGQERQTVYLVLGADPRLRYHVDRRRFFRTLASGATSDLLSLARASQILRHGQGRLRDWFNLLPYERHLATPPPPRPPRRTVPAPAPPVTPPLPPAVTPAVPPAAACQPGAQPLAQAPPPDPPPSVPAVPTAPFTLKAHRYWDLNAAHYCEVAEVLLEAPGCDDTPLVNSERTPLFLIHQDVPMGALLKVTVTWANGVKRTWEERLSLPSGAETEVFSPDG